MDRPHRLGQPVGRRVPAAFWTLLLAAVAAMPGATAAVSDAYGRMLVAQSRVRTVAPDLVAPPEIDPDSLERAEPRAPLGDLGQPQPPGPAAGEQGWRMFRPVATAAGRLEGDDARIAIAGIDIVEPSQNCSDGQGGQWPCGMRARTAFRAFLRGRAVECDLSEAEAGAGDVRPASCRLGERDLGAWLVENGWAMAASGGLYAEEQARAVEARRGIFAGRPPALPEAAPPVSSILAPEEAEASDGGG